MVNIEEFENHPIWDTPAGFCLMKTHNDNGDIMYCALGKACIALGINASYTALKEFISSDDQTKVYTLNDKTTKKSKFSKANHKKACKLAKKMVRENLCGE